MRLLQCQELVTVPDSQASSTSPSGEKRVTPVSQHPRGDCPCSGTAPLLRVCGEQRPGLPAHPDGALQGLSTRSWTWERPGAQLHIAWLLRPGQWLPPGSAVLLTDRGKREVTLFFQNTGSEGAGLLGAVPAGQTCEGPAASDTGVKQRGRETRL